MQTPRGDQLTLLAEQGPTQPVCLLGLQAARPYREGDGYPVQRAAVACTVQL